MGQLDSSMEDLMLEPSLFSIKAIAILDNDGNRLLAKYYDSSKFPNIKEQRKFEKFLFRKTVKAANEIIMLDGLTILYRSSVDIYCYVMGSSYENELILLSALDCLFSSLNGILRKEFEKKVLLDKMDLVLLALDERPPPGRADRGPGAGRHQGQDGCHLSPGPV